MTKYEFIENLRKALSGFVGHQLINENVRYYEEYIDMEVRKGRTEQEVLQGLGDPRLIAKTIIETAKAAGSVDAGEPLGEQEEHGRFRGRILRVPGWLLICIVVLIAGLILWAVGSVVMFLLPIVIPTLLVLMILRAVFNSRRK